MIGPRLRRSLTLGLAVFSLASLVVVTVAEAKVISFRGTRAQVHAACKALGLEAFDSTAPGYMGSGSTTCVNDAKGTAVTCNDNGTCEGSVPRIIGQLDLHAILAWQDVLTATDAASGGSLSGSGDSPDVPAYAPPPVIE